VFVTPRAVAAFIVLVLVYIVVVHAVSLPRQIIPIDFYQYWGAAAARRLSTEELGSPYREAQRYGAVLLEAAEGSGQPMFQRVSRHATPPKFTATPFAYTLFALLPANYTLANLLYYSLQIVSFIAGVIIVGVVYRYPAFPLVCLSLLLILSSGPLNTDLRLGNLGCIQFMILAILLALVDRLQGARPSATRGGIVLSGLTLLVLTKPNLGLVLVFMVLHLWVARGTRFLVMAAWPAALCVGAAVMLSSLHFGSWTVWLDWYDTALGLSTVGRRPSTVGRHLTIGNYSTPLLLGSRLNLSAWTSASLIAAGLAISIVAVVGRSVLADASARAAPVRRALARVLGDPHLAMALGVALSLALPPLVWYHYYIIAVIPSLWLLNVQSTWPALRWCGLAALLLGAGILTGLFLLVGWNTAGHVCATLSWLALWGGILIRLSESDVTPSHSEPPHRPERRPSARDAQHRRRSKVRQ
jgi:hypothetical protein